jgi:hypothetical protein
LYRSLRVAFPPDSLPTGLGGLELASVPVLTNSKVTPIFSRRQNYFIPTDPLGSRAWVLQEQFLSPRTLEFMPKCMNWRCISNIASEMEPVFSQARYSFRVNDNPIRDEYGSSKVRSSLSLHYASWYQMVEGYNNPNSPEPYRDKTTGISLPGRDTDWHRSRRIQAR